MLFEKARHSVDVATTNKVCCFNRFSSIVHLNLQNNKFRHLPRHAFDHVTSVSLGLNPWSCSCQSEWLKSKILNLTNDRWVRMKLRLLTNNTDIVWGRWWSSLESEHQMCGVHWNSPHVSCTSSVVIRHGLLSRNEIDFSYNFMAHMLRLAGTLTNSCKLHCTNIFSTNLWIWRKTAFNLFIFSSDFKYIRLLQVRRDGFFSWLPDLWKSIICEKSSNEWRYNDVFWLSRRRYQLHTSRNRLTVLKID